ncbi:MAG: tetratricopeptide repeat protein, partial [Bacteroidetes bacterium]|nr:tetratricopeptide repeat protein [Bacteroidota bacterium]
MKKIQLIFCVLIMTSATPGLNAQNSTIDSLRIELGKTGQDTNRIRLLNVLFDEFRYIDLEGEGARIIDVGIPLAENLKDHKGLVKLYNNKAIIFRDKRTQNLDYTLHFYKKALNTAIKYDLVREIIFQTNTLGYFYMYYRSSAIDSALYYYKMADKANEPVIDSEEKCFSLKATAFYYNMIGDNTKALEYAKKCEGAQEDNFHAYNLLGIIYADIGNYATAVDYYLKVLDLSRDKDAVAYQAALNNIAIVYAHQNKHEKALEYFLESADLSRKENDPKELVTNLSNLGQVYSQLGNTKESKKYYLESLKIGKARNLGCQLDLPTNGLGVLYYKQEEYDSAKYYLHESIRYSELCGSIEIKSSSLLTLAEMDEKEGNASDAMAKYLEVLDMTESTGRREHKRDASAGLYRIYKKKGKFQKALLYHEQVKANVDSIFNKETTEKITRMESEYEFNKERKAIELEQ